MPEKIVYDLTDLRNLLMQAAEIGFIACEQGLNLEAARLEVLKLTNNGLDQLRERTAKP